MPCLPARPPTKLWSIATAVIATTPTPTAIILRDAGVPAQKLFVYSGGYSQWSNQHLPVEKGERNSGNVTNLTK